MLFSSYEFLLFLAVVLLGFHWFDRMAAPAGGHRPGHLWLLAASLFFYGWWLPTGLLLIGASLGVNFVLARAIAAAIPYNRRATAVLTLGVVLNLAAIGWFKYADFGLSIWAAATGASVEPLNLVLPLGISFFTFQQISYLVDVRRGLAGREDFVNYCLYVTFFPQLIAGPIVHHREMMPQLVERSRRGLRASDIAVGLSVFVVGLAKKAVVADRFAGWASGVFTAAERGIPVTTFEAWVGALAYTFQLYFDFSGYSDMAVGLGLMFGLSLPLNFLSPYKARDIIDFWRRWHMTLSRFLRDYLYIPLGGRRRGEFMRYRNLFLTMLLGGLWHGAGWTFLFWGALHGVYLAINHAWRGLGLRLPGGIAWPLTFLAVVAGWVIFRAPDMETAGRMLAAMAGLDGAADSMFGPMPKMDWDMAAYWILGAAYVCATMPNVAEVFREVWRPSCGTRVRAPTVFDWLCWAPTIRWAVALGITGWAGVVWIARTGEFLYFNF